MRRLLVGMAIVIVLGVLIVRFGSGVVAERAIANYLSGKNIAVSSLDVGHASMMSAQVNRAVIGKNDAVQLSNVSAEYRYHGGTLDVSRIEAQRVRVALTSYKNTYDIGGIEALAALASLGNKAPKDALGILLDSPMTIEKTATGYRAALQGGSLTLTQGDMKAVLGDMDVTLTPSAKVGEYNWVVKGKKIQLSAAKDPLTTPLMFDGSGTASTAVIQGQGTLSDEGRSIPIIVRFSHEAALKKTKLQWTTNQLKFTTESAGLSALSPLLTSIPAMDAALRMEGQATLKDGKKPSISHTFIIERAALSPLLKIAFKDDIAFDGDVTGKIPFRWKGEKAPQITGAHLKNLSSGTLVYDPLTGASAALQGEKEAGILLEALRKFDYSNLDITANSDAEGVLKATFRIIGSNKTLYDGKTVDFTLNVNGNLLSLLESQAKVNHVIDNNQ